LAKLFQRNPTKTPFGRAVTAVHERCDYELSITHEPDSSWQVLSGALAGGPPAPWWIIGGLRSSAAGAGVTLGVYGSWLRSINDDPEALPNADPDPTLDFTQAIDDGDPRVIRAAYRVLLWGFMAYTARSLWAPEYKDNLIDASKLFGVENCYEDFVLQSADPQVGVPWTDEGKIEFSRIVLGELLSAALDRKVDQKDPWIGLSLPNWVQFLGAGESAMNERVFQVTDSGLPILTD
jgi:hypothetical protein